MKAIEERVCAFHTRYLRFNCHATNHTLTNNYAWRCHCRGMMPMRPCGTVTLQSITKQKFLGGWCACHLLRCGHLVCRYSCVSPPKCAALRTQACTTAPCAANRSAAGNVGLLLRWDDCWVVPGRSASDRRVFRPWWVFRPGCWVAVSYCCISSSNRSPNLSKKSCLKLVQSSKVRMWVWCMGPFQCLGVDIRASGGWFCGHLWWRSKGVTRRRGLLFTACLQPCCALARQQSLGIC
mmetsp:Transcript_35662/g.90170  ORF Transcript_35662/g.90170 Transcript_35662/m.90170 type:complete len:237 (+) Transcript_35662:810-1520(+)